MLSATVALVTTGIVLSACIPPLSGAEPSAPAAKPPGAIIITNATNGRMPYLSAGLPEIVKMHKAGVDASVLMAYVRNSPVAYHPSAKEIIYLRDQGISSDLISAMLQRGGELRDRAAEAQREERNRATPPPAAPPAAPAAPAPATPSPPQAAAPVVVYANNPDPVYPTYVNYAYSYAAPAYYNYAPYYRSSCYYPSYYRPSYYRGYYSGCYPRYGLSVGYSSGCYPRYGLSVGYRGGYGYGGGYRYAGGGYCRR
jgi:hypothetical protein